jgi:hypothetical protein
LFYLERLVYNEKKKKKEKTKKVDKTWVFIYYNVLQKKVHKKKERFSVQGWQFSYVIP